MVDKLALLFWMLFIKLELVYSNRFCSAPMLLRSSLTLAMAASSELIADWASVVLIWTVWVMLSRPSTPWMRLFRRSMTNAVTLVPYRIGSNIPVPT